MKDNYKIRKEYMEMIKKWEKRIKWIRIICMLLFMCMIPKQNADAAINVDFDTYYNIKEFGSDNYFQITVPGAGRIRVLIDDCTNNTLNGSYTLYKANGSSISELAIRYWRKQTETAESGWITVEQGIYQYYLPGINNVNNEAKMKIEYQSGAQYLGEKESNDSLDSASIIKTNSVYHGDLSRYCNYSSYGYYRDVDVDYYKFVLDAPGKVEILFDSLYVLTAWGGSDNIKYTLYEEDSNGNTNVVYDTNRMRHYRLPAGVYYLKAELREENLSNVTEEYTLQVNVTYESTDEFEQEYNNIRKNANIKKCNQWYTGNMNNGSDIDYYSFYVPVQSSLAMELKVPRGMYDDVYEVYLYDNNLIELNSASNTSDPYLKTSEIIVQPGTYYIRVEGGSEYWADDDYSISLCQQPFIYVSGITINGVKKMQEGENLVLSASVTPTNATKQEIEWSSSNTYYATVSSTGVVTAKNPGTVTITASATDGSEVEQSVTVEITERKVTAIHISGKAELKKSEGHYLQATVTPTDAVNRSIMWSSSNPSVVSVSSTGYIYANSYGTATIYASAQDGSGVIGSITINVPRPASENNQTSSNQTSTQKKIALNKKSVNLTVGQSVTLKLNHASGKVTWKTSKKSVATVNSKGVVKGKKKGTAKITAVNKGKKYTCKVTVKNPSKSTLAKRAYNTYAKKNLKKSRYLGRRIKYYDIDKNKIPEMIVMYRSGLMYRCQFYTYYKGKVVKMHSNDFSGSGVFYLNNQKKYIGIEIPDGSQSEFVIYKISKRKMKKVDTYIYEWYDERLYKNGKRMSTAKIQSFFKNQKYLLY